VYTTQEAGLTFNPRICFFRGAEVAEAFVGSNNLTVGGTEKNFEAAVRVELDVVADAAGIAELEAAWEDLLPPRCPATEPLDAAALAELVADGFIAAEADRKWVAGGAADARVGRGTRGRRSGLTVKPESPLPAAARAPRPKAASRGEAKIAEPTALTAATLAPSMYPTSVRGLAIQVRPHDNGEIFLSRRAVDQNPSFFKWPFYGTNQAQAGQEPVVPAAGTGPCREHHRARQGSNSSAPA
jgi:hypothetical protein